MQKLLSDTLYGFIGRLCGKIVIFVTVMPPFTPKSLNITPAKADRVPPEA